MKRQVIQINEALCNGCGVCVRGCHEGALQLIDGKAVMISDHYCDGLGACIGDCPVGAISLEEKEAASYDEIAVIKRLIPKGKKVLQAHLKHLKDHQAMVWLEEATSFLRAQPGDWGDLSTQGSPGSRSREITVPQSPSMERPAGTVMASSSELRQFPVQLHLINPRAGFWQQADVLLAADCTAFASGEFHRRFLKGKSLAIACPKLDQNTSLYVDKLKAMMDVSEIKTLTVLVMEVPCCNGLMRLVQTACEQAGRKIPIRRIVLSVTGEVLEEGCV